MADILISVPELASALASASPPRVLDVRWRLDRPDGRREYSAGHLPGAVYADLDADLSAHGAPADGRHPLPDADRVQDAVRRWGISEGQEVVVYDDAGSAAAARAWWVLTDAGLSVRILDGGLGAWTHAGHALEAGPVLVDPGDATVDAGRLARIDIEEAAALAETGLLLDVRAPERYRGDIEPLDPRAGHIPGAVNLPTSGNTDADGRFLPVEEIRARAIAAGADPDQPLGVYCGSGITAAHAFVALTLAGFAPRLYAGSWSQWANTPGRPVATGPAPRRAD